MKSRTNLGKILSSLAPDRCFVLTRSVVRRHLLALTALLAVAAIAGAVVLTPARAKPDAWDSLRKSIAGRAQVALFDDFSQGLDSWTGAGNPARTWSYDGARFASPGDLSLLSGSLQMTDYDLDALLAIQKGGLGFALRAIDASNYQAARLLVAGSTQAPSLVLERYAVIGGLTSQRTRIPVPVRFQRDTLFPVHLKVQGDSFALYMQGSLVDYWSDSRLRTGGVGLFCAGDQRARIAWVRVSHNADALGRFCSLLSSLF